MIALSSDSLVFETTAGDLVPCSVESVVVELIGDDNEALDPAVVQQATAAVLHYFRAEQQKMQVTVGEFAEALARVLRSFGLEVRPAGGEGADTGTDDSYPASDPAKMAALAELDLRQLATEPGQSSELFFFPRLRAKVRDCLARSPQIVRCSGPRPCVKRLAGARRWSPRCEQLQDQILDYLNGCLRQEPQPQPCTLVVR